MNKREFLKAAGMAGVAAVLPLGKIIASQEKSNSSGTGGCSLIPTETAGPFPLDLTENSFYFRQDVREEIPGVQLNLKIRVIGQGNCLPMQNVRVNIWHCSNEGLYSGYDSGLNPGQSGLTYLRGYQITDANGEVDFITIFPGWYPGRICHIHFQVYVNSSYSAVSQLTFDLETRNLIYTSNPELYPSGEDPLDYSEDGIFADGYVLQLASLSPNKTTGGYDSFLEVAIQGDGTTGVSFIEKQTSKYVLLGQNFPNPFDASTTIPFSITEASEVKLMLFDLQGRLVSSPLSKQLPAGNHTSVIDFEQLGLLNSNYAYQIEVTNSKGTFKTVKLMTAGH